MLLTIILLSIWIFIKTISYAIYEIKENQNKSGGVIVILISIVALTLPIYSIWNA